LAGLFIAFRAEKIAAGIPPDEDQFTGQPVPRISSFGALFGLLASPQISHFQLQWPKTN
jgi:hypothetical protein